MQRRRFMQGVLSALGFVALPAGSRVGDELLIQHSTLAGWQYHQGEQVWSQLRIGQHLLLCREAGNVHDRNAVAIHWQGTMIGYLPRRENHAVAQMLGQGLELEGRINTLRASRNPWDRVGLSVYLSVPGKPGRGRWS